MTLVWVFVLSACGGRTFDDPSFDEGPGDGDGGSSVGGRNVGGDVSKGGRKGTGGVPSSTGGVPSRGGAVGSGGAATTPPESCRRFCKQLVDDCGIALQLNDRICRSSCEEGFTVGSSACDSLRIAALACIENQLAQPMTTCDDVGRILSSDCLIPLGLWASCVR